MVNKDYQDARTNWETDTNESERREILREINYNGSETQWNKLPEYIRKKLESIYGDTLYPDETMSLKPNQDFHCNVGEIWVKPHKRSNGTYVHGYCRKIK